MQIHFHGIAAGGEAVGRDADGRAVFVPQAAPGDVGEVVVLEAHRSYARGRLLQIETASPLRTVAPCPYYTPDNDDQSCGGCQLQHLQYVAQLEAKRQLVVDALARVGKVEDPNVHPCLPSPLPFGYRNKADFVIGIEAGRPVAGFFAAGSHDLVDIAECLVQTPANNQLLSAARACLADGLATPFDPATGAGTLRRLVMRAAGDGTSLLVAVTTAAPWPQQAAFAQRMQEAVPSLVGVLRREPRRSAQVIAGRDWLEETVPLPGGTLSLRTTGESFFQVNTSLTPVLVETVLRLAAMKKGQRALDLFCGVGLFGLAMAAQGAQVVGVEGIPSAVRDAKENAARNGLEATFKAGAVERVLKSLAGSQWDVVVLDPPREGAANVMPALIALGARRVVYVSCDPATLARDLKPLLAAGYRFLEATPLDMFPQTAHVETVALLER